MRNFFSHWKILLALILLILLAMFTVETGDAQANPPLAHRLHQHVQAVASTTPGGFGRAVRHIETSLAADGYHLQRRQYPGRGDAVRNIEAAVANPGPGARPARHFIVGARYDAAAGADDNGGATAAVLELARLLRNLRPATGTEIRFVFFVNEAPRLAGQQLDRHAPLPPGLERRFPDSGSFIAFVGPRASSAPVRQTLATFGNAPRAPAQGLAAPYYAQGVTLFQHSSSGPDGDPALMVAGTAFTRYPYHHTAVGGTSQPDYDSMARVVTGLARTLAALAGAPGG